MDIARLSTAMAATKLSDAVGTSLMKMAMKDMKQEGADVSKMIDSVAPKSDSIIDISI